MTQKTTAVNTGDNYQDLANAVIVLAVSDLRTVLRAYKNKPQREDHLRNSEIYKFFHSGMYSLMTTVDPDYLINRVKKEVWGSDH